MSILDRPYSMGYDDAIDGREKADLTEMLPFERDAYNSGWHRAKSNHRFVSKVNEGDPSARYLSRETARNMKWS